MKPQNSRGGLVNICVRLRYFALKDLSLPRQPGSVRAYCEGSQFVNDIYKNEETELQVLIGKFQAEQMKRVLEDFQEAQEKGWIRQDLNLSFLLYMMNDVGNKVTDEHLKQLYPEMSDLIMELTKFFLYGIMPREEN